MLCYLTVIEPASEVLDVHDEGSLPVRKVDAVDEVIAKVHNARMGHFGVRRTWKALNTHVPGHGISVDLDPRVRRQLHLVSKIAAGHAGLTTAAGAGDSSGACAGLLWL